MVSRLNYSSGAGNKGGFNKGKHWTDVRWLFVSFLLYIQYNYAYIWIILCKLFGNYCKWKLKQHWKNFGIKNNGIQTKNGIKCKKGFIEVMVKSFLNKQWVANLCVSNFRTVYDMSSLWHRMSNGIESVYELILNLIVLFVVNI